MLRVTALCSALLFTFSAAADSTQLRKLYKCYGIFVRERIPETHALVAKVKSGSLSGADACMELLSKADLDVNGVVKNKDEEGVKILNTFLHYQNSQFEIPNYMMKNWADGNALLTADVLDTNEAAYHFLYALFGSNTDFSSVVTRNSSFIAVRDSAHQSSRRSIVLSYILEVSRFKTSISGSFSDLNAPMSPVGRLVGLKQDTRSSGSSLNLFETPTPLVPSGLNVFQHQGSGAIGTQSYLMANLAGRGRPNDGVLNIYRIWAKNVFKDYLCSNLPSLLPSDIPSGPTGWLSPGKTAAYRSQVSCMQCHASMDFLASGARNLMEGYTTTSKDINIPRLKFVGKLPQTSGSTITAPLINEPVDNFASTPAMGRLYYRNYSGKLVDVSFNSVADLGTKLAGTDDLYACAAKRYYKFLTGLDADLDSNFKDIDGDRTSIRNEVISLGQKLKTTRSLKKMIKEIVASDNF